MATQFSGIQLIPPPPMALDGSSSGPGYSELLAYRNRLVQTRNIQLEYQQNISGLHSKIKQACYELGKKDSSVKEDMEVLSLERGRLAYLRDELARRADMISRWESRVRESDPSTAAAAIRVDPKLQERKDRDRMNALLLEVDQRRSRVDFAALSGSAAAGTPETRASHPELLQQQVVSLNIPKPLLEEPKSAGVGSGLISPAEALPKQLEAPDISMSVSTEQPLPEPHPYAQAFTVTADPSDMAVCLDYIWGEYSTPLTDGDEDVSLMTLPNLMRLSGDSDFSISTQSLISLYLRCVKLGSNCLVEKKFFLSLLQSIVQTCADGCLDQVVATDALFSTFLFPLMHRLKMRERAASTKHPPLPRSPISGVRI